MAPRAETQTTVLKAAGVRGIVIRPVLVYGDGKGYDLPLITLAKKHGSPKKLSGPHFKCQKALCCDSIAIRAVSSDQQLKSLRDERSRGSLSQRNCRGCTDRPGLRRNPHYEGLSKIGQKGSRDRALERNSLEA
jgi:hypothetical protein